MPSSVVALFALLFSQSAAAGVSATVTVADVATVAATSAGDVSVFDTVTVSEYVNVSLSPLAGTVSPGLGLTFRHRTLLDERIQGIQEGDPLPAIR